MEENMKKLIFISLLILSCATVPPEQLLQQDIIDLNGMTKEQIYQKSLEWIANSFKSYKHVIEYQDKESGTIIGNIVTPGAGIDLGSYESSIKIECKDNKSRLSIQPQNYITLNGKLSPITGGTEYAIESTKVIKPLYIDFMKKKKADW
jgi:hypothetical protein